MEIKDFKSRFDQPVRNKLEAYEKLVEISRNNDYTTRNVLDYSYNQNYYKFNGIYLSRQTKATIPQQFNFMGKLEGDNGDSLDVTE